MLTHPAQQEPTASLSMPLKGAALKAQSHENLTTGWR